MKSAEPPRKEIVFKGEELELIILDRAGDPVERHHFNVGGSEIRIPLPVEVSSKLDTGEYELRKELKGKGKFQIRGI